MSISAAVSAASEKTRRAVARALASGIVEVDLGNLLVRDAATDSEQAHGAVRLGPRLAGDDHRRRHVGDQAAVVAPQHAGHARRIEDVVSRSAAAGADGHRDCAPPRPARRRRSPPGRAGSPCRGAAASRRAARTASRQWVRMDPRTAGARRDSPSAAITRIPARGPERRSAWATATVRAAPRLIRPAARITANRGWRLRLRLCSRTRVARPRYSATFVAAIRWGVTIES